MLRRRNGRDGLLAKYQIFETTQFQRDLATLARTGRAHLAEKLHAHIYPLLREAPHAGPNIKRLRGWAPATWRYRIGAWRFFYAIDESRQLVTMLTIAHRKEAYR